MPSIECKAPSTSGPSLPPAAGGGEGPRGRGCPAVAALAAAADSELPNSDTTPSMSTIRIGLAEPIFGVVARSLARTHVQPAVSCERPIVLGRFEAVKQPAAPT